MLTREIKGTVVFARPFLLRTIGRELPAGSYAIESAEEAAKGAAYQRVEVRLIIPSMFGRSEAETWILSPAELDDALELDRQPASRQSGADRTAEPVARASQAGGRPQFRNRTTLQHKGANTPLYGTLLGVLALLLAAAVLGREQPPGRSSPPPAAEVRK
ncbi:MAG TPA: hypothetical protein VIA80_04580 [Hyphomonadaceae bacterium]